MPHKHLSEHRSHAHVHKLHVHLHKHKPHVYKQKIVKKIPKLARFGLSRGRRFIESLQGKYKGKEIWILGTGSSMDDYPDNFFDDKISIGLKSNLMVFPNCTFHLSHIGNKQVAGFLMEHPEFLGKLIFKLRTKKPRSHDWVPEEYHQWPVYMWGYRFNIRYPGRKKLLPEAIRRIMKKLPSRYPNEDTISHLAIQAAAIMGAKKITLVGCEEKCVNGNFFGERYRKHYRSRKFGCSEERVEKLWKSAARQRKATRLLAQALKHYGVEVSLYHLRDSEQYKAGYLKLA